jgi:hypothetical protein
MAAVMVVFATVLRSTIISAEVAELLLGALSIVFVALGSMCNRYLFLICPWKIRLQGTEIITDEEKIARLKKS